MNLTEFVTVNDVAPIPPIKAELPIMVLAVIDVTAKPLNVALFPFNNVLTKMFEAVMFVDDKPAMNALVPIIVFEVIDEELIPANVALVPVNTLPVNVPVDVMFVLPIPPNRAEEPVIVVVLIDVTASPDNNAELPVSVPVTVKLVVETPAKLLNVPFVKFQLPVKNPS